MRALHLKTESNDFQISVLISTYNNRQFVDKKLAEIRQQTIFPRAEFIFIETASPTRERELIEPFCREHANCRLIALDQRQTLYEAWNTGWDAARAPLLCYSNMDDAMHPRLLELVTQHLHEKKWDGCSVLIAKQHSDEQWNDWSAAHLRRLPLAHYPGAFTAWRRDLKVRIGPFDGRFLIYGDRDFWARTQVPQVTFGLIPKILYLYTRRDGQLSKSPKELGMRSQDMELAKQKPYAVQFPPAWKRRMKWFKVMHTLFPKKYFVPAP